MKERYGIRSGALADHLPPVTVAAKNLATEMTNLHVEQKDLYGETPITSEHVQNNRSVRKMLGDRSIRPEELPPEEDIKKIERRLKSEENKLPNQVGKFTNEDE
jgi:DNA-damage-inducible protein D